MKIGILGGGMMGFAMGYRLSKLGHEVTILEAAPQIGGLSTWADFGDFTWDKYYHVILKSDASLLKLIEELNLSDKLFWAATKTGFLWEGKHVSMSNGLEFLTFPPLNLFDKARLGFGILYNYSIKDAKQLNGKKASDWLRSVFGNKVYETIWEPLLESKFGSLKDKIPAHIIWSTLKRYS
ncbi:MAG: FAD-dependent oxidoreductase, partial [Parachlamydiaceae bacterium]